MSSINKIHINGATTLSLNDRFTIMQKVGNNGAQRRSRSRSRSQSRSRVNVLRPVPAKASLQNRNLLARLDQKHKLRTALKIKRKSLKPIMTAIGAQRRLLNRSTAAALAKSRNGTAIARKRLRRSNSTAMRIATMKADLINNSVRGRRLSRTNSTASITDRLGVRQRPPLKRSQSKQRINSNLRRTNSKQNLLRRSNSQLNVRGRSNSQLNIRGRSNSRSRVSAQLRLGQVRPALKRSNSRLNLNNQRVQGKHRIIRRRSQSRNRISNNNSVNARLGVKSINNNTIQARGRNIRGGRIIKRRNQINNNNGNQQRVSRSRSRGRQAVARNRSRSRSRANNTQGQQQFRGRQIRGRSRSRGRGRQVQKAPVKTKEELDKELDQYMVNTKSQLDNEMEIYMKH